MHVHLISDNLNFGKRTLDIMFIYNSVSNQPECHCTDLVCRPTLPVFLLQENLKCDRDYCRKRCYLTWLWLLDLSTISNIFLEMDFFSKSNRQLCKLKLTPTIWNTCRWPRCTLNFLNDAVKVKFKLLSNNCHHEAEDMFLELFLVLVCSLPETASLFARN